MEKLLLLIILGSVIANYLLGVIKSIGNGFDPKLFWKGLMNLIKREIALLFIIGTYIIFKDIDLFGILYTPIAYFLLTLSTVYFVNGLLVNACSILGFENIKVLSELDNEFKKLMNKSFFKAEVTD